MLSEERDRRRAVEGAIDTFVAAEAQAAAGADSVRLCLSISLLSFSLSVSLNLESGIRENRAWKAYIQRPRIYSYKR